MHSLSTRPRKRLSRGFVLILLGAVFLCASCNRRDVASIDKTPNDAHLAPSPVTLASVEVRSRPLGFSGPGIVVAYNTVVVRTLALPSMASSGSHSTGRSHSHSSSHVRSYSGSHHHSRRSASSSIRRDTHGRIRRSAAAKHSFERQHPCPSTGRATVRCPGYVVDHVRPLECGGADAPSNMQWQTVADGKAKDKTEGQCR